VGGGTSLEEMKALAREKGIADHVTFTGPRARRRDARDAEHGRRVREPDVANEMNDKSTMNKIMEYMALGKPIVQFDLTEGRFSAQDASLYAAKNDPRDMAGKIVDLLDDPTAARRWAPTGARASRTSSNGATRCPSSWRRTIPCESTRGRPMRNPLRLPLLLLAAALPAQLPAQTCNSADRAIAVILDASGSMNAKLADGTTRIVAAQRAVKGVAALVPGTAQLSLRLYGAQSPASRKDCEDTHVPVPFGPADSVGASIAAAVDGAKAQGYTPIAHSLEQAAGSFPRPRRSESSCS
jgi:hypothetical protein